MNDLTFHHIGIATNDIKGSISLYQKLGYTWRGESIFNDPIQNVCIAFMECRGHPLIELIAPIDEASPVFNILQRMRTTPYHTCYEVQDMTATIKEFKMLRFVPTSKPVPAVAFNGRLVCFLYHIHLGLLELLEK